MTAAINIDVGMTLGKYRLEQRVGQGGMSVVYRAKDTELGRDVAVKVLHQHLAESQEAKDRFAREARAVAKLRHRNIVEIYDYAGSGADTVRASYIVTEFIAGPTLKQFITEHPFVLPELAAAIALQIAEALVAAHDAKVLHRDIKPENVMISADGEVKLMDFGISHMVDLERLTVTGQLLGSPAYMAPEHVDGKPIDYRTDVFALGTVLYQLATGQLPFSGKNAHEVLKRIVEGKCADPRSINPAITNRLAKLISTAMATKAEDRFQTIAAMRDALALFVADCGLAPVDKTLAAFFAAPDAYVSAIKPKLADALAAYGTSLLETQPVATLDVFDRVLTLVPAHPQVTAAMQRIKRRKQWRFAGLVAAAASLGIGATLSVLSLARRQAKQQTPSAANGLRLAQVDAPRLAGTSTQDAAAQHDAVERSGPGQFVSGAPVDAGLANAPGPDAPPLATAPRPLDAAPAVASTPRADARRAERALPDAAAAPQPEMTATLVLSPKNSEYRVGNGAWQQAPNGKSTFGFAANTTLHVRNDACCEGISKQLTAAEHLQTVAVALDFLPATITPRCPRMVSVRIDGRSASLAEPLALPFGDTTQTNRTVVVEFVGETIDRQTVTVRPKEAREVICAM